MPKANKLATHTVADLSKALGGISLETIRGWQEQGCPFEKRGARIYFDPRAVKAWMQERGKGKGRGAGKPSAIDGASPDTKERIALALLRKYTAQADKAEQDVAERRGELLPAAEVQSGRLARIAVVKSGLLALAARLSPLVHGRELREIEAIIEAEVRVLLEGFAEG